MKKTVIGAAFLAAGAFAGVPGTATAQSDKTLDINCTVAGHIHCGENRPIWGSSYRRHHYHRVHSRRYDAQRPVIRDYPQGHAMTGATQSQPTFSRTQGQARPETQGQGDRN